ncbi:hypothetical protein [Psychromonas sp. Urea-02u-13]|uniref:hypothetical protein n=1 Tax=Psychromonas sp. Urea-02u-13 TaxID=2058326 RepID=UPI0012FEC312|nr:hypothetical protein [Psychromonas sp. Urea-02u-13]
MQPVLSRSMLVAINSKIRKISTGKRRGYQKALSVITVYLSEYLQWSIPEKEKVKLQDANNKWFEEVTAQSANSECLVNSHQKLIEDAVKQPIKVNAAMLSITLLLETAPISLPAIFYLLTHPAVLEEVGGIATVCYPVSLDDEGEQRQYARYKLSALSYRLLKEYFRAGGPLKNIKALRLNIREYLGSAPFYLENVSDSQLLKMITCYWQKRLPNFFVKDFINPSNQFALHPARYLIAANCSDNSRLTQNKTLFHTHTTLDINPSGKQKWPHKKLLKEYKKLGKKAVLKLLKSEPSVVWPQDNILPQLYYFYVAELIEFGGVKKDTLRVSTIETYTNGDEYLNLHPLSFDDAISEEALNNWAEGFYKNAQSESVRLHLFYFLRFMAEQELTDALDIDAFQPVNLPKTVDANLVSAKELNEIMHLLSESEAENKFQQLFCLVAVILSFHGCLRRGEILRLRMQDVEISEPKGTLFRLTITNTAEGRTKNGKSRVAHIELPIEQAKLLRLLLKIKEEAHYLDPLIGFSGELISSRERQYILPITRAIKSVCGPSARFHHLRHGGAFVLASQVFVLFTKNVSSVNCVYLSALLQEPFVKNRFSYWLEGRGIEQVNSVVALDVIADMIGHSLFETTRKSYLHGHEWIGGYFTPQVQQYSKLLLRYILGLNVGSNDISRQVNILISNDIENLQSISHSSTNLLPRRVHEMAVNKASKLSWLATCDTNLVDPNWTAFWIEKLARTSDCSLDLLIQNSLNTKAINSSVTWEELSKIKQLLYRNKLSTQYKKTTYKLIKQLLCKLDIKECSFEMEMTKRAAVRYEKIFKLPEFAVFNRHFTLFKNRGTLSDKQELFIAHEIFIANEKLMVEPIHLGKTKLVVRLELSGISEQWLINIYRQLFL